MIKPIIVSLLAASFFSMAITQASTFPATSATEQAHKLRKYGGFAPGTKFAFHVTDIYAVRGPAEDPTLWVPAPVPAGIPNFGQGKKVQFNIGKKGQLANKAFSMKFVKNEGKSNGYAAINKKDPMNSNYGHVFKNSKNKPTSVSLSFVKATVEDGEQILYTVMYTLK